VSNIVLHVMIREEKFMRDINLVERKMELCHM